MSVPGRTEFKFENKKVCFRLIRFDYLLLGTTSVSKKLNDRTFFVSKNLQQIKALLSTFIHGYCSFVKKKEFSVFTRDFTVKKAVGSSCLLVLVNVVLEQPLLVLIILELSIPLLGL